ncbi:hypothetical protein RUND412_002477 [Rhizina undulata]
MANPRPYYLLQLSTWKIVEYANSAAVQAAVKAAGGYGVISYTWGRYWKDRTKFMTGGPAGVTWGMPLTTVFTMAEIKSFLQTMGKDYVWWDMACVPQGTDKTLTPELYRRQLTEIGNQRWTYEGAAIGKIWVHQTDWTANGAMKQILLKKPDPPVTTEEAARDAVIAYVKLVQTAVAAEPWLTSIWTFQEGIMLTTSELIDKNRRQLIDTTFLHGKATMVDLTKKITFTAIELTQWFTQIAAHPATWVPPNILGKAVKKYPTVLRGELTKLLDSGLTAYSPGNPLHLVAARKPRLPNASNKKDFWFAALGGLQIVIPVDYNEQDDTIKKDFLGALVDKYQWRTLLFATVEDKTTINWLSISDGDFWPLGSYFDSFVSSGGPPVPLLSFDKKQLLLKVAKTVPEKAGSSKMVPYKVYNPTAWTKLKRYRNIAKENGVIIDTLDFGSAEKKALGDIRLLPFETVDNGKAQRCILARVKAGYWIFKWIVEAEGLKETDKVAVSADILLKLSNEA